MGVGGREGALGGGGTYSGPRASGGGGSMIGTCRAPRLPAGHAPSVYETFPLASVQRTTSAWATGAARKNGIKKANARMGGF
jgi:hypothetical protein